MDLHKLESSERQNEPLSPQPCAGFTIIETCIAMLIMFIAVLGSVSLFAYSIKNNSGANDRELAMAVAQKQMEQLRNVSFTDASLNVTSTNGTRTTLDRAGRQYLVRTDIVHSNVVDGAPTVKTITIQVLPTGSNLGAVTLRAVRTTNLAGPNR
jgi:type II secretion system protein I